MLRTFRRGAAVLVATTGLTALAGSAGAQSGGGTRRRLTIKRHTGCTSAVITRVATMRTRRDGAPSFSVPMKSMSLGLEQDGEARIA